jgi:hypothetical protein
MAAHGKLQVATRVFDGSINSPREGRLHNKSTGLIAGPSRRVWHEQAPWTRLQEPHQQCSRGRAPGSWSSSSRASATHPMQNLATARHSQKTRAAPWRAHRRHQGHITPRTTRASTTGGRTPASRHIVGYREPDYTAPSHDIQMHYYTKIFAELGIIETSSPRSTSPYVVVINIYNNV